MGVCSVPCDLFWSGLIWSARLSKPGACAALHACCVEQRPRLRGQPPLPQATCGMLAVLLRPECHSSAVSPSAPALNLHGTWLLH